MSLQKAELKVLLSSRRPAVEIRASKSCPWLLRGGLNATRISVHGNWAAGSREAALWFFGPTLSVTDSRLETTDPFARHLPGFTEPDRFRHYANCGPCRALRIELNPGNRLEPIRVYRPRSVDALVSVGAEGVALGLREALRQAG